jgi:adenylate kinase family enzyme
MASREPPTGALPDRIWVVGPCGAGKSTVARRLAGHLGVEALSLDEIHWRPGWVETPPEETARRIAAAVARPRWVIDGNYTTHRRAHADRIQLYVWLDFPLRVTFPRLLRRGVGRSVRRTPICNGNHETLLRTFCHKDSLLLWSLTSDRRRRRVLTDETATRPHVRLRSQRAVDRWLDDVLRVPGTKAPQGRP